MVKRGPRLKTIRRLETPLPGLTRKQDRERAAHGARGPRRRQTKSDYRHRLEEKQKVRFHYGITEGQLRRYFTEAARQRGVTGHTLLTLLERRLDNVIFRLGLAPTIPAARQLVTHGHVHVDGQRMDRPAYQVEIGQTVALSPRARARDALAHAARQEPTIRLPGYLERDAGDPFTGRLTGDVAPEDIPFIVDPTAIVEFYAR